VSVDVSFVHFSATSPAPFLLTTRTGHVSASLRFLGFCFAAWACSHIRSKPSPNSKTTRTFIMTLTFMPFFATPHTCRCPTFAHRLIFATTRLSNCVLTVWSRAPPKLFVLTNLYILLNFIVQLCFSFVTKLFYLSFGKLNFTPLKHTSYVENFAVHNIYTQMVLNAI